jgi:acyl-CoA synthetase (AMP-forming)/AMP-acid ligase II
MSTTTSPDDGARIQPKAQLALLSGPSDQALLTCTLGELLSLQAAKHSEQLAVVSWTGVTLTYQQLYQRSRLLASSLLSHRIVAGDHVGIYAENCEIYIALLFAIAMVGGVSVVLNANYTPLELSTALRAAGK